MKEIKIVGLVFALCAFSALADDITVEKYPDADVVLVDERIETVYQADGTYVTTEEDWKKALTERGRRSLSSLSIGYSLRYGRGEILLVEIIDAEGKARAVDFASTLKEATDNSSTAVNIYDPLDKVLSCAIPGIKIGETLHVKTRRTVTKSRVKDQWADMQVFESMMPIVRTSVKIDGPVSRPLKSVAVRNPIGNVVSSVVTNGERIVYSWTVENSPQMFPEPAMPPFWTQGQNLRVSTAANWQELSKWYWDVSVPHLEKTNAAMTNKVEEIVAKTRERTEDKLELVKAIYKFVSQEIRYMGLTMEDTSPGYAPHDVDLTFDNRYGVCRDKAALLVAMLRIAGFESYPVLIRVSAAKMDQEVPTPFFNHAIVSVKMDGDYILMDPTDESSRDLCPAYLGDCSYLVAHPSGEGLRTAPIVPPEKNAFTVAGSGRLGKDGSLLADYAISFRGINDNTYRRRFLSLKPEQRRELFEKVVEAVSAGAELMRCDIEPKDLQDTTKELGVKLLIKYPEVLLRGETRDELSVPSLSSALGAANWLLSGRTALESRKYPLKVSSTALAEEKMEIDLAGSVGATATMPDDKKIEGGYEFTRTFSRDGDKLVFARRLSVGTIEFSPDEYLNLREKIKQVEATEREKPAFEKDRFANANERIISSVRTYDFFGDSSWVSTNTVVKEILTYKGKKNAAELKFFYNPSWKTVELVSASVSNKNGQVVFAGPKETSVLDADWVSSAPRYPASKQLVVNLPSVEIGSVISYTVVTTVKDAPTPFYANFYFDTFTPTDFLSVRVGDWKREVKNPRLLPDEKMLPSGVLWRDHSGVSLCNFAAAAEKYRALDPEPVDPKDYDIPTGIVEIRDWMARHIRSIGPSFGEIRLEDHVVAPEVVLKERYATRLGYIRTLCALLKGAGYDADIVFAGDTADSSMSVLMRDMYDFPNVSRFSYPICRVTVKKGGFLWWGGETTTYYLGMENEYTPLGATGFNNSLFLDPKTGGFATVTASDGGFCDAENVALSFSIRENGAVDLDYSLEQYGASVGSVRKRYAEMLPEIRSRHFQQMLGKIAQSASATRELVTDTDGYPFALSFSAFIPDMAVVTGDAISFEVPQLAAHPFGITGATRELPIGIDGEESLEVTRYSIVFPKGYTEVESLPAPLEIRNPANPGELWVGTVVTSKVVDDVLSVDIVVSSNIRRETMLPAEYLAMLKEWNRLAGSKANSTIVVRRRKNSHPAEQAQEGRRAR